MGEIRRFHPEHNIIPPPRRGIVPPTSPNKNIEKGGGRKGIISPFLTKETREKDKTFGQKIETFVIQSLKDFVNEKGLQNIQMIEPSEAEDWGEGYDLKIQCKGVNIFVDFTIKTGEALQEKIRRQKKREIIVICVKNKEGKIKSPVEIFKDIFRFLPKGSQNELMNALRIDY